MSDSNDVHVYVPKTDDSNGLAVTAMILGIIGLVIGLIPFIGWFMLPLWVMAIIFGVIGMRKQEKRGFAVAGLVLGVGTFIYKIGFWVLLIIGSAASM